MGSVSGITTRGGAVRRRRFTDTIVGQWISTTDHKKIGILYIYTSFIFFLLGGIEALIIRTQLAVPNNPLISPGLYNEVFTMHATIMIFLFMMPMWTGFGNYLVPLMIGARDVAFPRLNAASYWLYASAAIVLATSLVIGTAPDGGWFQYTPLTDAHPACFGPLSADPAQVQTYTNALAAARGEMGCFGIGRNTDFWIVAVNLAGISSIVGSINLIVTILRMRAPGMSINRMPLFCWMVLITSFLLIFALPSLTVSSFMLLFDRHIGMHWFQWQYGGDPLLWQHLFWSFGHPEVYVLILPGFGMISEVIPVFSRKPLFGYTFVAWSGVAIGFLSFTVWAHHMFATGLPVAAGAFFATSTTLIAVPTAVKIFNWVATTWGGKISFSTAMLFAIGFIGQFLLGGLNGIAVAVVPFDWQVTDSYFVVSHLHYVLPAGAVMALFAGIYYWMPKMSGRMFNERLGKLHFWLFIIGTNLAFFPMHILGLLGMPRRQYTYPPNLGWEPWNLMSSIGAYILGAGVIVFLVNWFITIAKPATAPADPWDGFTLEWTTSSPPPPENFPRIPVVRSRRPAYDAKHPENPDWAQRH